MPSVTRAPRIAGRDMEGRINIDGLITHTMALENINDAFDPMRAGKSIRSVAAYERERSAAAFPVPPIEP